MQVDADSLHRFSKIFQNFTFSLKVLAEHAMQGVR